jgi:hypothetical protein
VKTDYRDAVDIAWMLRREEGEAIEIPTKEDESTKDLFRRCGDLKENLIAELCANSKISTAVGALIKANGFWPA